MSIDSRLDKLMPVLSAKERAVLILRSMKEKAPEDPAWRRTMPPDQTPEFNRYINLMNAANQEVAFLVMALQKEMEKLELRAGWLFSLHLWRYNLSDINFTASLVAREPITASAHRELVDKARDDYILASQLAVILAEEKREWCDDDLEEVGWTRELVVKPGSWKRLHAEAEREIRQAVEEGKLDARGAGKKLAVRRESFDAWLGRPVTVYPNWAAAYEIVPDDREVHVAADRNTLRHLQNALEKNPIPLEIIPERDGPSLNAIIEGLERALKEGLRFRWDELLALERLVDQIAAEFDGEDPLKPHSREGLKEARLTAEKLGRDLEAMGCGVELGDVNEDEVAELRAMLERNGVVFRLS